MYNLIIHFLKKIEVYLIYSVSGTQYSDSVIHYICMYIHIYILFQIIFHYSLLQDIEYRSLCYTVGPCWLSILNIAVCTCQSQTVPLKSFILLYFL